MKFGIQVNEGPFTHQASDSAYLFVKAAIEKGHQVMRVFFYYDGVNNANKLSAPSPMTAIWSSCGVSWRKNTMSILSSALLRRCVVALSKTTWPKVFVFPAWDS